MQGPLQQCGACSRCCEVAAASSISKDFPHVSSKHVSLSAAHFRLPPGRTRPPAGLERVHTAGALLLYRKVLSAEVSVTAVASASALLGPSTLIYAAATGACYLHLLRISAGVCVFSSAVSISSLPSLRADLWVAGCYRHASSELRNLLQYQCGCKYSHAQADSCDSSSEHVRACWKHTKPPRPTQTTSNQT